MGKINFAFTAVQAGQKSSTINAEPRITANSTIGKFVITSPVSKALNVAVGENIMFLNNIPQVEAAIAQRNEQVVEWANENGIDLETREGQMSALKELTVWAIAKGVLQYNAKGEPLMGSIRYTKDEKLAAVISNVADFLANDAIRTAVGKAMQNENFTDDELLSVLESEEENDFITNVKETVIACVVSPQYHMSTGSKTSTTGSATGVGCQLSFTDTAIWNALKADLGDAKDSKNRNYKVCLEEGFEAEVNDGQKSVKTMAYPIEFIEDTDPIVRSEKQ